MYVSKTILTALRKFVVVVMEIERFDLCALFGRSDKKEKKKK